MARGQGVRRHPRPGRGAHGQVPRAGRRRPGPGRAGDRHRTPSDGTLATACRLTSGDRRYTTTELLAAEERIVALSDGTASPRAHGRSPPPWWTRSCNVTLTWTGNRLDGVRKLLTSGNGYDLVVGQAGTGKSTMLAAARIGWEQAGFRVIGTAVAARTAADLEAGTGMPSSSLTHLLADLRRRAA